MAAAGTGLSMYGADKKKKALQGAENDYMNRVRQFMAAQQAMSNDAMAGYGQISDEHNAQLGTSVQDWLGADQKTTPDANYAPNVQSTVAALRGKTGEQNPWNAQSGASQAAIAQQGSHANTNLQAAITAGQASDRQRRLGLVRENALQPYTFGEMSRAARMQRLQQALALRQAGLNNGFALDKANLQGAMTAAGRSGDHALMWGTLLQQLGGSSMGGYQAPSEAPGGEATQAPGANGVWAGYDQPNMYTQDGGMYA